MESLLWPDIINCKNNTYQSSQLPPCQQRTNNKNLRGKLRATNLLRQNRKEHVCALFCFGGTKRSVCTEREVFFANEVHFVREVCLRHDKERFASRIRKANLLHIAQCAILHVGFSRHFVFAEKGASISTKLLFVLRSSFIRLVYR